MREEETGEKLRKNNIDNNQKMKAGPKSSEIQHFIHKASDHEKLHSDFTGIDRLDRPVTDSNHSTATEAKIK